MAKCLVTGHKGYIGSRLFKKLKELGHDVQGIDLVDGDDINKVSGLAENPKGNFNDKWASFKPEYIFHLACIPRVMYSIDEPVKTMKNNVLAGSNVFNFAKKVGAKRVIYSSSSSIVGNGDGPESPYALQKMTTEIECKLYAKLYGIDTVSLRYFNVYSFDQKVTGPYATAVANWMHYIREGKTPYITGDGEQRRDMLNVEDAVSANVFAMEYDGKFEGRAFDVGTGNNVSLNEMKELVNEVFPSVEFKYIDPRSGDVMLTKANTALLEAIGWKAENTIKQGVKQCFEILKQQMENKNVKIVG